MLNYIKIKTQCNLGMFVKNKILILIMLGIRLKLLSTEFQNVVYDILYYIDLL